MFSPSMPTAHTDRQERRDTVLDRRLEIETYKNGKAPYFSPFHLEEQGSHMFIVLNSLCLNTLPDFLSFLDYMAVIFNFVSHFKAKTTLAIVFPSSQGRKNVCIFLTPDLSFQTFLRVFRMKLIRMPIKKTMKYV